jgi:hypothetical protein
MKKFILLLMFFVAKNINAQNGWTTYTGSIPTGTSSSQENVIFIDNAGNKWIGFKGGAANDLALAKYNPSTNTWTYWNKQSMGITSTSISVYAKDIEKDNAGNIWIGMTSGLIKYDGINFTVFNTANGLPSNSIFSLEYSNNMLYIGTSNGMSRYDGITFTNYTIGNSLLPVGQVTDIKAENSNTLWMTSANKLIKFYINSSFTSTSYTLATTTSTAVLLYKIYIDASGNKWFSNSEGIVKYDNINFTYFSSMYPEFVGCTTFAGSEIGKGPNGGVMVIGTIYGTLTSQNCLIEFLSTGTYSVYNIPPGKVMGTSFKKDVAGKYSVCGSVSTPTTGLSLTIHSFDFSNYSIIKAFGWGSGINNDNFKFLDINRVKAGIMNRGDMWWDIGRSGNAYYEVPKVADPSTAAMAGFAASLWIGGLDASNQLHTAAQTYRQAGNDFWPGPLDTTNASIDSSAVVNYDKIWKVSTDDINTFLYQYSLGNVPLTFTPTPDILSWPAKGTGVKSRNLAPFVDVNNNGVYDPLVGGDYPKIKGDQTLYFIFNDNFGPHTQTGGLPFGIEVHTMAYAYGCPSILNGRTELAYTTFYDYKIYNRSNNNYHDVFLGFWNDLDLGDWQDDYIGCSVEDNLGFCYNADGYDNGTAGANGYGYFPPAVGTTVLKGPIATPNDGLDNNNDGITDELGEECLMNAFNYYNNSISGFPLGSRDPLNKYHYFNYLSGQWRDSTNLTCGGTGYGGTIPTKFVYPGNNPLGNPCGNWTESTAGNPPGDRRYIVSSGQFELYAQQSIEIEYAYVWSTDSFATSNVNLASMNKLISDTRKVRSFYKSGGTSCVGKAIGINEKEVNESISIYPNPANSVLNIRSENYLGKSTVLITDILGKTIIETKNNDLYNTSINIEQLNSGVYLLQLRSEKGLIVKKFIKQ